MIVSICNIKGGVGKTTSAVALAEVAKRSGKSVQVLDADAQGTASEWILQAQDAGLPLSFDVAPANMITLQRVKQNHFDYVFIDCPPSGQIIDRAISVSDFVIIPTSTSATDLHQARLCVETMKETQKPYAVLIVKAEPRTIAFKECKQYLDKNAISYFDTFIPKKEAVNRSFGKLPKNMSEYEKVFVEMKG